MKKKKKNKKKYYLVLSRDKNYRYGAFPHTEEGLKMANEYIKKCEPEELYIVEK
jgi:hypothetical protein